MPQNDKFLRIPRDATFPAQPLTKDLSPYAFEYFLAATKLWEAIPKMSGGHSPRPDNLVYPILFLIHHFLELELKDGIMLTYSLGSMTGELVPKELEKTHDLSSLLTLLDSNLAKLSGLPDELPLSKELMNLSKTEVDPKIRTGG